MKKKVLLLLFLLAGLVRTCFFTIIMEYYLAIALSLCAFLVYTFMLKKKCISISYMPVVMADFIVIFYFATLAYGVNVKGVIMSLIIFILSSGILYYLLGYCIGKYTSEGSLRKSSNYQIDKGIEALNKENYDEALDSFLKAIKEHKKNYLGYMGVYNTLTKQDKKNLKAINYYKNKCIKYAPKELKESINNRLK